MVDMEYEILDILFVAEDEGLAEMYKQKLELDGYRVRVVSRQQTRSICRPLPSLAQRPRPENLVGAILDRQPIDS